MPPGLSVTIDQDAKTQVKGEIYSPHSRGSLGHYKGQATRHVSGLEDRAILEGGKSDSDSRGSKKGRAGRQRR